MPMTEDFGAFLNSNEHGTVATYKTTDVVGIFENLYVEVSGVGSMKPTYNVDEESVPNIARGNKLYINNVEYRVAMVQPDGTGMTLLVLEAMN